MASAPPLVVDFLPAEALGLRGRLGLCMAPGRRDGVHSQNACVVCSRVVVLFWPS